MHHVGAPSKHVRFCTRYYWMSTLGRIDLRDPACRAWACNFFPVQLSFYCCILLHSPNCLVAYLADITIISQSSLLFDDIGSCFLGQAMRITCKNIRRKTMLTWEIRSLARSSQYLSFEPRIICTWYDHFWIKNDIFVGCGEDVDRFVMPQGLFATWTRVTRSLLTVQFATRPMCRIRQHETFVQDSGLLGRGWLFGRPKCFGKNAT